MVIDQLLVCVPARKIELRSTKKRANLKLIFARASRTNLQSWGASIFILLIDFRKPFYSNSSNLWLMLQSFFAWIILFCLSIISHFKIISRIWILSILIFPYDGWRLLVVIFDFMSSENTTCSQRGTTSCIASIKAPMKWCSRIFEKRRGRSSCSIFEVSLKFWWRKDWRFQ